MFARIAKALRKPSQSAVFFVPTTATALQAQASLSTMASGQTEVATFANGCFWGTEKLFRKHYANKGLIDAKVGFIGGKESAKNPSYEEVCTGSTGHAEAAQLKFDPSKLSYAELVEFFYRTHASDQKDRQGNDRGTQYRSALFPHSAEQLETANKITKEIQDKFFTPKGKRVVTQIEQRPASDFFEADAGHQQYLDRNPHGYECSMHYVRSDAQMASD